MGLSIRRHGDAGPTLIVVHGGPGAPGGLAPVAAELSAHFRVLEPWQRPSGGEPLTVARHVADLQNLIAAECGAARPALLGASWGAMLVLAHAAAHPEAVGPLILVGSGTFDPAARARMKAIIAERLGEPIAALKARIEAEHDAEDARLAAYAAALEPVYQWDSPPPTGQSPVDARANAETWADMIRLQEDGTYPAAFAAISAPVLMLHGDYDPHPGAMIRDGLLPLLPRMEYHAWERCGHEPWRERGVSHDFYTRVRAWLQSRGGA